MYTFVSVDIYVYFIYILVLCISYIFLFFQVEPKQIEHDLTSSSVTDDPERVQTLFSTYSDPYEAAKDAHAIVVLTDWDEFKVC